MRPKIRGDLKRSMQHDPALSGFGGCTWVVVLGCRLKHGCRYGSGGRQARRLPRCRGGCTRRQIRSLGSFDRMGASRREYAVVRLEPSLLRSERRFLVVFALTDRSARSRGVLGDRPRVSAGRLRVTARNGGGTELMSRINVLGIEDCGPSNATWPNTRSWPAWWHRSCDWTGRHRRSPGGLQESLAMMKVCVCRMRRYTRAYSFRRAVY